MPSLKSINAEAGTNFRRWKEVSKALMEAAPERCESCKSVSDEMRYDNEGIPLCPSCWYEEVKEDTVDKPVPQHIIDSMPDFPPRITNPTELRQMQGAGYQFHDGFPVKAPRGGDYQTGDATWRFDGDGNLISVWEPVPWNEARTTMFHVITEEPLKDGLPNFEFHHAWINYNYTESKLGRIRAVPAEIAAKRVAWFEDGEMIVNITIGELLQQSLILLKAT